MSTNLGALTTFTPTGASCHSFFYATNPKPGSGWLELGDTDSDANCLPTNPPFKRRANLYYSPGVCPVDFHYACSSTTIQDSVPTTVATCCPRDFECVPNRGTGIWACRSSIASSTVTKLRSIFYVTQSVTGTTIYPLQTGTTIMTLAASTVVAAYGPIIQRAKNDATWPQEVLGVTDTTTTSATDTTTTGASSDTSTAPTTIPAGIQPSSANNGLSAGAWAGIVVGSTAGALLLATLGFLGFRFRSRARARRRGIALPSEPQQRQHSLNPAMPLHSGVVEPSLPRASPMREELDCHSASELQAPVPSRPGEVFELLTLQ